MRPAIIHFDGGSRPNPGPMEIAVVVGGKTHCRDDIGSGDNNEAEWLALLLAVELATAARLKDVRFVGDSTLVIQQASRAWPCRSMQLKPYLATYIQAITVFDRVVLRHVPRSKNLAGIALARRDLP